MAVQVTPWDADYVNGYKLVSIDMLQMVKGFALKKVVKRHSACTELRASHMLNTCQLPDCSGAK